MSAMRFRYRRGMNNYGGYRGKERLNRDRSRASRCQARQLIEEYIEAEEDSACRVRIGHRSEFIPSVAETEDDAVSLQEQLSLPLDERSRAVDAEDYQAEPTLRLHAPEPAASTMDAATVPLRGVEDRDEQRDEPASTACQKDQDPVEKPRRPAYEWFADRRPARPKNFQRGHFFYGCALGTAAAAAILAMLRVAFM